MGLEKWVVSRDDSIYEAFPDVVLTAGGKLVCVFLECRHHGDRHDSRVMLTYSTDRGRTWSPKQPFSERSQPETRTFNCPRISRLADHSLAVVCDRVQYGKSSECGAGTSLYLWRGDPEGTVWGGPYELPLTGIVPDRLLELKSGRWLLSAHRQDASIGKLVQYAWYSDDQGRSWSDEIVLAKDERYNCCEASILALADGTLVAFLRENSGCGIDCLRCISKDQGESWEGVYLTPIPGCHRPVAGLLQDGRILVTHRFMQGGKGWLGAWTQNVFASWIEVDGILSENRNDLSVRIMPLDYDRSAVSDLGYTGWVQFEDGELYVVNYIVDDAPNAQIRGYSFRPEDAMFHRQ